MSLFLSLYLCVLRCGSRPALKVSDVIHRLDYVKAQPRL